MKLTDILSPSLNREEWEHKGYKLPSYDREALVKRTAAEPTWLHFGAGNIFRAFPAAVLQQVIESGAYDRGVIVAEGFDYEIIEKAYHPFDNLSLLVTLRSDGGIDKTVIGSVTESLKADPQFPADWARLEEVFTAPSLQMVSFTITEKGYGVPESDLACGLEPKFIMGKVTALLLKRYLKNAAPVTLQSMDNCAHNGDKVEAAVKAYAKSWVEAGLAPEGFLAYLSDPKKVSYPWSMIDKITPRPDIKVQELLAADGFEDRDTIITSRNSYTAAFVNAEETEYLICEDNYVAGRLPLEKGGVLYTERETVDKVEKMKVCTCLNPLHTALAIYGCLLGHTLISEEMKDEQLYKLVHRLPDEESMRVVVNPGILRPEDFLAAVLEKRFPNPFMPDTPQRIATDTSQKLAIRFGETLKAYHKQGLDASKLELIPLVLAGYGRYLAGVEDDGTLFTPSSDPLLAELQALVAELRVTTDSQDFSCLRKLYSRKDVFGVDLYELGLGEKIEKLCAELYQGPGAVRKTLKKYVG